MKYESIDHEIGMADFIIADKRGRILQLLSSEKGRSKIVQQLYHFNDWSSNVIIAIAHEHQNFIKIASMLADRGSPEYVYIVSANQSIDARVFPLEKALSLVVKANPGTFLSCIPGQLGYFEGENRGNRFILQITKK